MKGRSFLKEPSGSTICAFCAHGGAIRRPSQVQRRFLQSTRPAWKPPATAEALREESDEGSSKLQPAPSWGGGASWGQPSTGKAGDSAAWPSWGQSASISQGDQLKESTSRPKETTLLPHELRARELVAESQKRQVNIRGAGPQSSRAGRPLPTRNPYPSEGDRRAVAASAVEKRDGNMQEGRFSIRRHPSGSRHELGDIEPRRLDTTANRESEASGGWSQLRRRGQDTRPPIPPPVDSFTAGRAQRMEEARLSKFTPLAPTRTLEPRSSSMQTPSWGASSDLPPRESLFRKIDNVSPWTAQSAQDQPTAFRQREVFGSLSPRDSNMQRSTRSIKLGADAIDESTPYNASLQSKNDDESRSRFSIHRAMPIVETQAAEFNRQSEPSRPSWESGEKKGETAQVYNEGLSTKPRKLSGRMTEAAPSYDAMPKGKGRDKAKRRQQFVERDDVDDEFEEARRRTELRKQRKKEKEAKKAAAPIPIMLPEYISVSNLAMALKVRVEPFIEKLEELGYEETGTDHILNAEDSGLIAMEYNYEAIIDRGESEDLKPREPAVDPSILPQRPPVVTIMGHVDHGKTTLLDWLRKSSVAATEHGGITQHIGAFSVPMPSGKVITFLDTPGHAAFISMRQRGANVTDIVILVVAADDSVKPQTIEAIKHAKEAKVPIIVAINKIDKEEANISRVKQDLARHGVDVEDYGGDTQVVCVSGKTGKGMGELEEAAVTLSEILDMRAETDGPAEGWVLEASIKSMGKVATILVRRGTMRPGDFIVAGKTWARIRCLRNEAGVNITSAGPGTPVEIDGWREQPEAGDEVLQAIDEAKAKSVVDYRLEKAERDKMAEDMEAVNESRKADVERKEREKEEARLAADAEAAKEEYVPDTTDAKAKGPKEIFFIIKGDVSGSVEAVNDSISALGDKEVQPHVLRYGVGQVSEFDIEHAAAANGHVISFNTPIEPHISQLAERSKVTIFDHNIIYRLVDDVRAELSKHLPPIVTQRVVGEAEIAQIFEITVKGRQQKNVAGCKVRNGAVARNSKVRVLRNDEKVFDGSLASLKNGKRDVQEMKKGTECGLAFEHWFDFQVGDLIQAYEEKEEKRYLKA